MVGQLKEDVAEWYQGLSAHMRIEAMCTLIDLSMPFEIRFLGSLIEHLGRKDFGSLREAESKANSFTNANPDDKKKLLKSLAEVTTGCLVNGTQYVNPLMHPNSFNDSPGNRPSPTHSSDSKGRQLSISSSETLQHINDHGLSTHEPSSNNHDSSGLSKGNPIKGGAPSAISNHIGCSSEEETESMCITNDHKRRKLILYISVLQPTNHDCANLYYTVLSDIEDSPALAWIEDLDKDAQEEVSLLYTLASRHPAFTFEQRMFLGAVANRVNETISSKFSSRGNTATPQQTAQVHNHSNPATHQIYTPLSQTMDPKYPTAGGYYFLTAPHMHVQAIPHQPSSASNNGEQIRNTAVSGPFAAYGPFGPLYVSHPQHHPATGLPHPTALNPQYAQNMMGSPMQIPPSSSALTTPTGPNLHQPPPAAPVNSAVSVVNSNHQLPSSTKSQHSSQPIPPPHVISSATNSISQQSCVSTPSRASSSVPYPSEANSVDGDSAEESSENCDWNSPESSPFESPPQSLTPSRSQSPPSGVPNSTPVQAVSLSGHSSTFLVTSTGSSMSYGGGNAGPANSSSSNCGSSSSAPTVVKTEIHSNSGFVITTATSSSTSTSSSSTSVSNSSGGGGNGHVIHSNTTASSSNNSVNNSSSKTSSSSTSIHHNNMCSQQSHHLPPPPSSSSVARSQTKNTSSVVSGSGSNQSFSHPPPPLPTAVVSSVISVPQQQQPQQQQQQTLPPQMMSPSVPVHMQQQQQQQQTSVNNVGGVVSHSMSSVNAPPLAVAFAQQTPHGAHNNLGLNTNLPPPPPQQQSNYPCFAHMNAAVSFGGMNTGAAYRAPSQGVLTRNPYVQAHPTAAAANVLLTNQMVIKGNDVQQRGVHSLRQKTPLQNTPKRRSNVGGGGGGGGLVNMSTIGGGPPPHANNSQSTSGGGGSGKGDEVSDLSKDMSGRTNEIVVSANPSSNKSSQQQQQERTTGGGKSYHHNVTNGLVNSLSSNNSSVSGVGAVLPGNSLPNSNSVINNPPPQAAVALNSSSNPGGQIIQTAAVGGKGGEDGLLGDGGAVLDNYPSAVNQLQYHINGPQIYGHPQGPYIQIPNGYMASSYYHNPAMAAAAAAVMGAGGPGPVPPSTEIMMNPAGVPHFSFPFTIPQSFSSPQPTNNPSGGGGNKCVNNVKDASSKPTNNSLHGNGGGNNGGGGNGADSSSKTLPTNQLDSHGGGVIPSYPGGPFYTVAAVPARTPTQPNRNNRGVILDIGGALGNSSLSPVNVVDVAVMPPLDELVETVHRPRKISCYNCGASNHLGPDCKEGSMEEMTRHQFRVNYSGPSSVTADGKDGD